MTNERSYGAVVYRWRENEREFLLIKHQKGGHFGFPKGHMEKDELPIETAHREIFEETGLDAYIYDDYQFNTHYKPKPNIQKEVVYFIGRPIDNQLKRQEKEIADVLWCSEKDVKDTLTHEGDKVIFDQVYERIASLESGISSELLTHIEETILPLYDQFDEGHHRDHIYEVIKASFELVEQYPAKKDIVYLIACYHDLGLRFSRDTHHITSGKLLKNDRYVINHYSAPEINIMVDAIFDHRASNTHEPRTIYGKILSEADRLLNVDKVLKRTVQYELHKHPDLDPDEQLKNAFEHIVDKYGKTGYLKRFLDYEPNRIGDEALKQLIADEDELVKVLKKTFDKYLKPNH